MHLFSLVSFTPQGSLVQCLFKYWFCKWNSWINTCASRLVIELLCLIVTRHDGSYERGWRIRGSWQCISNTIRKSSWLAHSCYIPTLLLLITSTKDTISLVIFWLRMHFSLSGNAINVLRTRPWVKNNGIVCGYLKNTSCIVKTNLNLSHLEQSSDGV